MFFSKVQLVLPCYTIVLYEPIFKLYICKHSAVYISVARVTFFLQGTGIEKPVYKLSAHLSFVTDTLKVYDLS